MYAMKRNVLYYMGLLLGLVACSESSVTDDWDKNIGVNATVGDIDTSSRAVAEPFKGKVPTSDNKLLADVWFSTASGTYEHNPTGSEYRLPCRTSMEFDGTLQFAFDGDGNNLKYNPNNDYVYCVGLYPEGAWETTDNTTAGATFDGKQDLMFAKEISGNWQTQLNTKNLLFEHQLTWLKVCICATSQESAVAWGNVSHISIDSHTKATVTLSSGQVAYGTPGEIVALADETVLHTTMKEVGSVFCSPVESPDNDGNYTYTVNVTVGGKNITKPITLLNEDGTKYAGGSTKGKLFILTLYFNPYDMVEGVCTLTAWNDQNEDLYLN